jgi:hypothetical protein
MPAYGQQAGGTDAAWLSLIGERGDADDTEWHRRLSSLGAILAALSRRRDIERARLAARWHRDGDTFAVIARRTGLSRSGAQKLVERGRVLLADSPEMNGGL